MKYKNLTQYGGFFKSGSSSLWLIKRFVIVLLGHKILLSRKKQSNLWQIAIFIQISDISVCAANV